MPDMSPECQHKASSGLPDRLAMAAKLISSLAAEVRLAGSDFHADSLEIASSTCVKAARAIPTRTGLKEKQMPKIDGIDEHNGEVVAVPPLFNWFQVQEEPNVLEHRRNQLLALLNGPIFKSDRRLLCKTAGITRRVLEHLLSPDSYLSDIGAYHLANRLEVDADYFELTSAVGPMRRFKAGDGKVFANEVDCVSHDALLAEIAELIARLPIRPKSLEIPFANGCGYIQHDAAIFTEVRESLVRIGNRFMPDRWFEVDHTDFCRYCLPDRWGEVDLSESGRRCAWDGMVYEKVGMHMMSAWERVERTDKKFREWGSAYYVTHPEEATQTCLNAAVTM